MKKITTTIALAFFTHAGFAQTNSLFLRRDTIVLQSEECNWLMPREFKTDSTKTVSEWLIQSIKKGKIQAIDPNTDRNIPSGEILFWNMPSDTVGVEDGSSEFSHYVVTQHAIDPSKISRIKIQQDWYLDPSNGKLFSRIKWVDLMIEVYNPSGMFLGYKPFCRINY
jgi:hypothetical protein